jgi:membrane-associated phospholipid phosphatase
MESSRRVLQKLRPYDVLTLGYLAIVLLFLVVAPHRPPEALRITVAHGAAIAGVLLLAYFADRSRILRRLHDFYPLLLFIVLFGEFTGLSTALFPYWLEPLLVKFDLWLFGGPPLSWVMTHLSPLAVEFFALAYCTYYLIIPAALLFAYRKNYPHGVTEAATKICLTMYTCYLLFILVPARGPHHALPGADPLLIKGGFITGLLHRIQGVESVQGAAFPSSHVAVAWVAFFILRRYFHRASWPLGLLMGALTLSVVVMGYHFSLDAIGGLALGFGLGAAMGRDRSSGAQRGF